MHWKHHHLAYLFGVLLSISLMANMYFYTTQPEKLKKEIEISSESSEKQAVHLRTKDDRHSEDEQRSDVKDNSESQLESAANQFITFVFTWEDGTYPTRKRQARQYMSESIKRTLFASSGSDGKFTASVADIDVFPSRDDPEHCLVRFQRTLTIDANGYEETSDELVELTFTHHDGRYIVDQMKSLHTSGGV
ncbi:hypothetical protein [Exiguobacterium undae]|uniref:hypothetical protein n=1 Tax=Exiguobacterium undae TaxID=169177 RepID=UPI00047EF4A1|nr:hypothetical protein [Exiguobacterium undae]